MAMYPDYDVLHINELPNGDLHLENDSFWYPSFTEKLLTQFLETRLKIAETQSNFFALQGCINSFVIPSKHKKEFYNNFNDKIFNNTLRIKTDYNEKAAFSSFR